MNIGLETGGIIKDTVLDLVFPPSVYCICCGNIIDETRIYSLCDHCMAHIRWYDGKPFPDIGGMKTMYCTVYGLYERTMVFNLKYHEKRYIAREIACIMRDRLEAEDISYDIIVPVPMYRAKEIKRGFNQASLIAEHLAKLTGSVCYPGLLCRTGDTRPMRGLSPEERMQNVKDMFTMDEAWGKTLQGKRVLLIDDIFTTGSTARECASALRKHGAKEVMFLAFAAGKDDNL